MRAKRRRSFIHGLPLSAPALASVVFSVLWWHFGALTVVVWKFHDKTGGKLSGVPEAGLMFAICAGLLVVLLLANTLAEMIRGGPRRRLRVLLNAVAIALQILVLFGSLEMRHVSLLFRY